MKSLSRVRLLVTPWTAAHQAPPSMDFPGKGTGVGCHCLLRILDEIRQFNGERIVFSVNEDKQLILWLFSHQVMSKSLQPHGLQHTRLLFPPLSPSLLKFMSIEPVMASKPPSSLSSIFPSIRVFSKYPHAKE